MLRELQTILNSITPTKRYEGMVYSSVAQHHKIEKLLMESNITPEQTAKELIEMKVPIAEYEKVQSRRKERLKYWQEHGIQVLIDKEKELVEFGEEVLSLLIARYK